ncbi:MAG: endonuclease domain-containing protein [Clostridia bacterium]|nr:endonuclease domain-containing protein [Clostridia bacterium]MBR5266216.1 endonuclease domain-containing protein [Clostridia bacterium]
MPQMHNKRIVANARELRKNMTREEKHLWYDFLSGYPVRVLRQRVIGNYIVDFYCAKARIVIELDGSQHYDEEDIIKDAERTAELKKYNLEVVRIPNNEVKNNFNGVCEYLDKIIKERIGDE